MFDINSALVCDTCTQSVIPHSSTLTKHPNIHLYDISSAIVYTVYYHFEMNSS